MTDDLFDLTVENAQPDAPEPISIDDVEHELSMLVETACNFIVEQFAPRW